MSVTEQRRDSLDVVEDEILLMVRDSEALLNNLKGLPDKEETAKELGKSIMAHLSKVQEGLLDKVNLLADYIPYEQSTTQSRLKARQAKADLASACSALETFPPDDGDDGAGDYNSGYEANRPSIKRMRRTDS